jgi:hypothetical protein
MKKLAVLLIAAAMGWHFFGSQIPLLQQFFSVQTIERSSQTAKPNSHSKVYTDIRLPESPSEQVKPKLNVPIAAANIRCDGRTHCSQMTSCQEATWFLRNCPGTKMDGNNDGIPCEQQWCK